LSLLVVGAWPWAEGAGSKEKAAWRNSNAKGTADSLRLPTDFLSPRQALPQPVLQQPKGTITQYNTIE
jgi:hypothetical protein